MPKRVMILATDGFEQSELEKPRENLQQAGFDTVVVAPHDGQINPDKLRMEEKAVQLVREFCDAGKPVAAICHGPWLLAEADVIEGKTVTSWPSIRTDLSNAGANVVDQEVVQDGQLITSRKPDDIPAFSEALIKALEKQKVAEPA